MESLGRASSSSFAVATRAEVVGVVVFIVGVFVRGDALESMNHALVARERSMRAVDARTPFLAIPPRARRGVADDARVEHSRARPMLSRSRDSFSSHEPFTRIMTHQ